ncbi:hypothetical protein E8E13_007215 [Curvularia kusanoi]|uniref:Uncharacterized protein n=1 Tax=Curvularia kusanoi TaxID=90978 RepID=A0A9P4TPN8_CURKU|nr:hypothetical protein E8E13_007215 [Curvularia kusanoi]
MSRRLTLPSSLELILQEEGDASDTGDNSMAPPISPSHYRSQSVSEVAQNFPRFNLNDYEFVESIYNPPVSPVSDRHNCFIEFCRGQPPKRSFLSAAPPRLRMSRRSTLADKPELDGLLGEAMIQRKNEKFLPLVPETIHLLTSYLKGNRPVTRTSFANLMINGETNKVSPGVFIVTLEQIGQHCKHLAIIAPFHTTEFVNATDYEHGNPEPGSDWGKILSCFPNLDKLTYEDQSENPIDRAQETYFSLNDALANSATLTKYVDMSFDVSSKLNFDFRKDFHRPSRSRHSTSNFSGSGFSTPLTMKGTDVMYAEGVDDVEPLEDDTVFGKLDGVDDIDE